MITDGYMRAILELQRRDLHRPEQGEPFSIVGGLATTVTADGITQKVFHRWPEDRIGERIAPAPIDWSAWRTRRSRAKPAVVVRVVEFDHRDTTGSHDTTTTPRNGAPTAERSEMTTVRNARSAG